MSVRFMFIRGRASNNINKIFYNYSSNNSNHLLEWLPFRFRPDQYIWSRGLKGTEKLREFAVIQKK